MRENLPCACCSEFCPGMVEFRGKGVINIRLRLSANRCDSSPLLASSERLRDANQSLNSSNAGKKARDIVKKATTKKEVMTYEISNGLSKRSVSTLTYTRAPNLNIGSDIRRTSIVRWYERHGSRIAGFEDCQSVARVASRRDEVKCQNSPR